MESLLGRRRGLSTSVRKMEYTDIRIVRQIKNSLAPSDGEIRFSITAEMGFQWLECKSTFVSSEQPKVPEFESKTEKAAFDIMEWDEDLRYRFRGQFLEQGDNKMMLFAFDEPEMIKVEEIVLPPKENTEEDEGETVKKKIYIFPPEWAGTFGQPITSIAQVGILRQEHYAGNWDVFRPATEIEEMNIFTAESLNELLREAEKIMEGWTDYR